MGVGMRVFLILALLGVAPFIMFFHVIPFGELPSYWISASVVTLGLLFTIIVSGGRVGWSKFHLGLAACLAGLLMISALGGGIGQDFRGFFIYCVVVFVATILFACLAATDKNGYYRKLAIVMVAGGVVQAISAFSLHYGLLPIIGRWMIPPGSRMTGLLAQPNLLAICIFISFLSLCYLYIVGRVSLLLAGVIAGGFGIVLAGSGSRAALIYGGVAFIGSFFSVKGARARNGLSLLFLELLLCVPIYFVLDKYLLPVVQSLGYVDRLATIDSGRDYGTIGFRLSEWHKAVLMLWQHPWLGVGPGNYGVNSFWMGVEYPWAITENSFPTHSHNAFAQVAAEFGFPGIALVIAALLIFARRIFKSEKNYEWWLAVSVISVFSVNAMVEYAFWDLHFAVLFFAFAVPLWGDFDVVRISKLGRWTLGIGALLTWTVLTLGVFDIYSKAIRYNGGVSDALEAYDLKVAGEDALLGREMELLYALRVSPSVDEINYYDGLTERLMSWRPVNIVLMRRMQVAVLKKDYDELDRVAYAMARFYPKDAAKIRDSLSGSRGRNNIELVEAIDRGMVKAGRVN